MRSVALALVLALLGVALPTASSQDDELREWWVYLDYEMEVHGLFLAHDPGNPEAGFADQVDHQAFNTWLNFSGMYGVTSDGSGISFEPPPQTGRYRVMYDHLYTNEIPHQTATTEQHCDVTATPLFWANADLTYANGVVHGVVEPLNSLIGLPCNEKMTTTIVNDQGTKTSETDVFIPPVWNHAEMRAGPMFDNGATNHWGAGEIESAQQFRFDAAVDRATDLTSTESGPIGGSGSAITAADRYCAAFGFWSGEKPQGTKSGTCTWTGHLHVFITPSPCDRLRDEFKRAFADYKDVAKDPFGTYPPPVLQAWGEQHAAVLARLLAIERQAILLGCEMPDWPAAEDIIFETVDKHRRAWVDLLNGGAEARWIPSWLGAERQAILLGLGAGPQPASVPQVMERSDGTVGVSGYSPVKLDAYALDGRHVGWNESTNASEIQVAGANYTGQPGGPQTLTLPGGLWRIAVTELSDAPYLLNATWSAPGLSGGEEMLAWGTAGRTSSTYYGVAQDGAGNWTAQTAPFVRQTTASFAPGFARPLASAPAPDVATPFSPVDMGGGDGEGAPSGDDGSGATPGTGRTAPFAPLLVVLAAAGAAVLAQRRR
ncbi:MAG TPA: hypothetical protein VM370_08610 [Candidatus Thermoplasmatota archaeon]|nr:hypothetical protein [Candidatus Thermoplasmatota archaeon]